MCPRSSHFWHLITCAAASFIIGSQVVWTDLVETSVLTSTTISDWSSPPPTGSFRFPFAVLFGLVLEGLGSFFFFFLGGEAELVDGEDGSKDLVEDLGRPGFLFVWVVVLEEVSPGSCESISLRKAKALPSSEWEDCVLLVAVRDLTILTEWDILMQYNVMKWIWPFRLC